MPSETLTATPSSVRWLRAGVLVALLVAVGLFALDLRLEGLPEGGGGWRRVALVVGLVMTGILVIGAVCEGILRLPWRGAKPFLFAATVIPVLGGLGAIALPEGVMHVLTQGTATAYSLGRGLKIISILTVPLAGAVALVVAVSFASRWSRALPAAALAVLLTLMAREVAVRSFHGGWCAEAWAFNGEARQFPSCTGIFDEGPLTPIQPDVPGWNGTATTTTGR